MLSINKYNLLKNSILLFLLLFLCTANGNAETVDINGTSYDITTLIDRDLGPGINYKRIRLADFPLNVNILQMDMNNPYNRIETTIGQDQMFKTESLVAAANRQSYAGHEVVAGANANFWCVSSQYPWADYLIGACYNANLKNGKIATETNMANDQWVGGYKERSRREFRFSCPCCADRGSRRAPRPPRRTAPSRFRPAQCGGPCA